jgi:putative ABC transport system permease protein
MKDLLTSVRLARRELRGGLRGFWIFLACLALGVAAIATVRSVSSGILEGLRADGRAILGGDVSLRQIYTEITEEQRAFLERHGRVSLNAEMRSMARSGDALSLVELKAVDGPYPLYGQFKLQGGGDLHRAVERRDGRWGAVVEEAVLSRLGIRIGDEVRVGDVGFELRGVIEREPDRAAGGGGFSLGPRMMVSRAAVPDTGLIQPGSLIYWNYLVALPEGNRLDRFLSDLRSRFPDAGWRIRDFNNASPQLVRFIERMTMFLTLVGLTALLVGGVGVGNAVRAYLDGKVATIATLKCLGAPGPVVFNTYLVQILTLAAAGIGIGVVVGATAPLGLASVLAAYLPVSARISVYPSGLAIAAAFGFLTTLAFGLWPLGRAREVPAAALFRDAVASAGGRPRIIYIAVTALAAATLAGLAIFNDSNRLFASYFVGGAILTLIAFWSLARLIMLVARGVGRPRRPGLRLALANLHRPGAPTPSVVLSLGLGLTVLVAIALIQGNFTRQVQDALPKTAPAYYFIDIQPDQMADFTATILSIPGASDLQQGPVLRGRIVAVNGVPAEQAIVNREQSWVLQSDRGMTYAAEKPADDRIVAGEWWPRDYSGPPLISIADNIAQAFGIGPGAKLTASIVGRDIEATVGNVREVQWGTLAINYSMIFAPGILEAAPKTFIATVRGTPEAEAQIQRVINDRFPNITSIRVKDALDTVNRILGDIGTAVRVTAVITLIAGTLVLAGAVAAGHRRRVYDAVVLKVLGATRADVLRAFLLEYGLLGLVTAVIAGCIGTLTAWVVLTQLMDFRWTFIPSAVMTTAVLCTAITLAFGFVGTWRALGQKAAPLLRNE